MGDTGCPDWHDDQDDGGPRDYYAGDDDADEEERDYEDGDDEEDEDSPEEPEPPSPTRNARRSKGKGKSKSEAPDKGKGKGKVEPAGEPWPLILEILAQPGSIKDEVILLCLDAFGGNASTTMEVFEALSAKDIAEAIDSEYVKASSTIMERALLFKLCKNLAILCEAISRPHSS